MRTRSGPWWWAPAHRRGTGPAFPGTTVITSAGDEVQREIESGPALVVCDAGAEPQAPRGYGAALLLTVGRCWVVQDLRAAEDALRRWMAAAAQVHAGATAALSRWSRSRPSRQFRHWSSGIRGSRGSELDARADVGLPPSVHMAAVDGGSAAVAALIGLAGAARSHPDGARRPAAGGPPTAHHRTQTNPRSGMLIRVARDAGLALSASLRHATAIASARHDHEAVRVQIDPLHMG